MAVVSTRDWDEAERSLQMALEAVRDARILQEEFYVLLKLNEAKGWAQLAEQDLENLRAKVER